MGMGRVAEAPEAMDGGFRETLCWVGGGRWK